MTRIIVQKSQVDEAVREFEYFENERSGHFTTNLFKAFLVADRENFFNLAKGFPAEAYAVAKRYKIDLLPRFDIEDDRLA